MDVKKMMEEGRRILNKEMYFFMDMEESWRGPLFFDSKEDGIKFLEEHFEWRIEEFFTSEDEKKHGKWEDLSSDLKLEYLMDWEDYKFEKVEVKTKEEWERG